MPALIKSLKWPFGKRILAGASLGLTIVLILWLYNALAPHNIKDSHHMQDEPVPSSSKTLSGSNAPAENAVRLMQPSQSSRPRCSLTKVSMLYGAHKFPQLESALESHQQHSNRWGCSFRKLEHDLVTRKLYSKHYFLLSIMLEELSKPADLRQQWLMWVDADSIVLNPALSPEIFLPPENLHHVYALLTADQNGLNDGVFYLRVHPSSIDLLTQTVAYPLTYPDEDLGWFGEQAAMANVISSLKKVSETSDRSSGVAWLPRMWFNAYQTDNGFQGEPGNILVHFAGLAETRLSHMTNWLNELRQNQAKWEVPFVNTFYKDDVAKFWAEFEANASNKIQS